jgi:hypothetical protein
MLAADKPYKRKFSKNNLLTGEIGPRRVQPMQLTVISLVIVALAAIVPVAVYRSLAGGSFFGSEVEGGALSSGTLITKVTNDATASGNGYIMFNLPPCPSGQQGTFPNCTTPPANDPPYTVSGFPLLSSTGTYTTTLGVPLSLQKWSSSQTLWGNRKLPSGTPKAPNSDTFVVRMGQAARGQAGIYPGTLATPANAPYMFFVDGDREQHKTVKACTSGDFSNWGISAATWENAMNGQNANGKYGVPMPDFNMNSNDSDFDVNIYDYKYDTLWEFWIFKTPNLTGAATPTACWGGMIKNFSQSSGQFAYPYGASAAGVTFLGNMITFDDIKRGSINHAIAMSGVFSIKWNQGISWPANRGEGSCDINSGKTVSSSWGSPTYYSPAQCMYEGQRLRLPSGYDTNKFSNPMVRMIADAIKNYGLIDDDGGGCGGCIRMESTYPVTQLGKPDPLNTINAYGGLTSQQIMAQLPWEDMQLLPKDYQP